jgi:hypothetical protein
MCPLRLVLKTHLFHGLHGDAGDKLIIIGATSTSLKRSLHLLNGLLFTEATLTDGVDTVVWLIYAVRRGAF